MLSCFERIFKWAKFIRDPFDLGGGSSPPMLQRDVIDEPAHPATLRLLLQLRGQSRRALATVVERQQATSAIRMVRGPFAVGSELQQRR